LDLSPTPAQPTPKKIENTTICRISFFAMPSAMLIGTRWVTKSAR
jgi:hypothetical protein